MAAPGIETGAVARVETLRRRALLVKLDRALVMELDKSRRNQILVSGIVRLCVDLGAKVVAEGLETWDEIRAVRDCGCHYGQGYALGRPVPKPEEATWEL